MQGLSHLDAGSLTDPSLFLVSTFYPLVASALAIPVFVLALLLLPPSSSAPADVPVTSGLLNGLLVCCLLCCSRSLELWLFWYDRSNQPHPDLVCPGDGFLGWSSSWTLGHFLLGGRVGLWFSFFMFLISHLSTREWGICLRDVLLLREPHGTHKSLAHLPVIHL